MSIACLPLLAQAAMPGCFLINDRGGVLSYIEKISNVQLPEHINVISEFDNVEFVAGGKYRIDKKDLPVFLHSYPFEPLGRQHYRPFFNSYAGKDSIPISQSAQLKYFSGCKPGNTWLFIINENTGELWIEIHYPDFSGQTPPCDKTDGNTKLH